MGHSDQSTVALPSGNLAVLQPQVPGNAGQGLTLLQPPIHNVKEIEFLPVGLGLTVDRVGGQGHGDSNGLGGLML